MGFRSCSEPSCRTVCCSPPMCHSTHRVPRADGYPDFRSGYDRGHMVPAADAKISQDAMDETFFLSNIAPQVGDGFNRHCMCFGPTDLVVPAR